MSFFCSYYIIFDKLFRRIQIPGVRKFGSAVPNIWCAEKDHDAQKDHLEKPRYLSKLFGIRSPQKYSRILEI